MNEHNIYKEETLQIVRELEKNSSLNQRLLSQKLNISLGKTNYLLKELVKKGMIKIVSFSQNPGKVKKVKYLLTKKGVQEKVNLTYHFLKVKQREYKQLKEDLDRYNSDAKPGGKNVYEVASRQEKE
ncbi:MAG: MarR family EPS-associated transcriptional regulator [Candidatus Omnitrophica bacterium]|nr:MarR family EPS-associated transcriptional regulator [Candidatus Omnitrophota bacterium]